MKQKVITPQMKKCFCGSEVKMTSWEYGQEWVVRVECIDNNHSLTRYCGSTHKAICKWNNRVGLEDTTKFRLLN